MKNLILSMLAFLFVLGTIQAQDGDKELKEAGNALKAFELDQTNNKDKLKEAVTALTVAEKGSKTKADPKTWLVKGDVYNAISSQVVQIRQLNFGSLDDLPKTEDPAYQSAMAYAKALELAEKKYDIKDATKGLQAVQSNLYNMGIYAFQDKNYDLAYKNFNEMLVVHDILKKVGETSTLDVDTSYQDQLYLTGLAAVNGEMKEKAAPLFDKLMESNYDEPGMYEAMYQLKAGKDRAAAYTYLEKGRQKYPDDISLLFAEINHFLKEDKLDVLISKLELAIEKEPDNVSLYSTLGNVYDNLYQRAAEAGETEKAATYFDKSLSYYNQALTKKPEYFDAIYSIGALYFNRAASMTQDLNKLADDLTRDGQKKYDELKGKIDKEFDLALPFFKRAEKMNPNDINTLIALKEIFARKNDFEKSNAFKDRLQKVNDGEKLSDSYFCNNE